MELQQFQFSLTTEGRGFVDLTDQLRAYVVTTGLQVGLCHVFLHHTSASIVICENADDLVQCDMEAFMQRLIPDGDPLCQHVDEGPDDMPSHVRTMLTQSFLTVPITNGHLGLGRWQGIYLWEHRLRPHTRTLTVTLQGNR